MADLYLRQIQTIQPKGPYIIGGASFGATVAVEICKNLSKEEVITIPVLDGWAVYPHDLRDGDYFRKSMQQQQNDWKIKFGAYEYTEFQKLFNTQKHRLELLYNYDMKEIPHKISLFKSKEIMDIFTSIDSYDNNWTVYTKSPLEVINVDGNHETMFQEPYVKNLALKLSVLLDKMDISRK